MTKLKPREWWFGENNSCPTSTDKKKRHIGVTQNMETVTKTVPGFRGKMVTVTSFLDHTVCKFCGEKFDQEWIGA